MTYLVNQRGLGHTGGIVLGESLAGTDDVRVNLHLDVWGNATLAGTLAVAGQVSAPGFAIGGAPAVAASGGYAQWNCASTDGSTWFLNQPGTGTVGGWQFAKVTTGNVATTVARLDESGNLVLSGKLQVTLTTPASSTAACVAGQITANASYVYVCTATNTWKRAALTTW
ncbi:MAG: hypothetical protein QM753_11315 [Thermomicrobiales bacterium]